VGGGGKRKNPKTEKESRGGLKKEKERADFRSPGFFSKKQRGRTAGNKKHRTKKKKPSEEEKKRGITEREKERAEPRGEGTTEPGGTKKKKGKSRLWFPWFLLKEAEETNEQEEKLWGKTGGIGLKRRRKNWKKKPEKKPAFPALLSSPERKRKTKKTGEKTEESVTIV
jgi:hypothetical protein